MNTMNTMKRTVGVVMAVLIALIMIAAYASSDNMNSRFTDGSVTLSSLTASAGTITTLVASNFYLEGKKITYTKYRAQPTGKGADSVTVAGVDSDDIVIATISEVQAAADSNVVLWNAKPATPTAGKVYLKFSKTPTDSVSVGIITIQD